MPKGVMHKKNTKNIQKTQDPTKRPHTTKNAEKTRKNKLGHTKAYAKCMQKH